MDTIFFPSTFFLLWAFPNFIDTRRNYSCFCLRSKITAAMKLKHACSWKESYNKPRQYTKSRDIILLTKVCIVKPMVFLVVTYKCESWIIKKAERQRTDAFQLWCWRRLLRVPWMARKSNYSILKEINPEYSSEELRLKLKLQYFGHLMRIIDSLEKTLMLGKIEERRSRGGQRIRWLDASPTQWTCI